MVLECTPAAASVMGGVDAAFTLFTELAPAPDVTSQTELFWVGAYLEALEPEQYVTSAAVACGVDVDALWARIAESTELLHEVTVAGRAPAHHLAGVGARGQRAVRQALVENPRCPADTLTTLVSIRSAMLRDSVAAHPNSDASTFRALAEITNLSLATVRTAAAHPNCPPDARHTFLEMLVPDDIDIAVELELEVDDT